MDITINDLDIYGLFLQLFQFSQQMAPLAQITTYVDNTVTQGWTKYGSAIISTTFMSIFH